ncbi:MAG: hypothetical protein ACXIUO_13985 [Erythrobacter sp.]
MLLMVRRNSGVLLMVRRNSGVLLMVRRNSGATALILIALTCILASNSPFPI